MALTILGPPGGSPMRTAAMPQVEIRQAWSDSWSPMPELQALRGSSGTSQEMGRLELEYRYGDVKQPWGAGFSTIEPVDLTGWWVRVLLYTEAGSETLWVGRIAAETRTIHGKSETASGVQQWIAYEPLYLLERVTVADSFWLDAAAPTTPIKIGWVPGFNGRDERHFLVGNRTEGTEETYKATYGGTHLFGGNDDWTHFHAAEYLLGRIMDESAEDPAGPKWVLGGQAELLKGLSDVVPAANGESVAGALRRLIDPRFGVDWMVTYSEQTNAFEVQVFALLAEEIRVGGKVLPKNHATASFKASDALEAISTRVVRTVEQRNGEIRVQGQRVVCCFTLENEALEGKWSTTQEDWYKDPIQGPPGGSDLDPPNQYDELRKNEAFKPVYAHFGAPSNWDHNAGAVAPVIDSVGQLQQASSTRYQNKRRKTLSLLPLRSGWNYAADPPVDNNLAGHEPEFLPPQAWILTRYLTPGPESNSYKTLEELGIDVGVPELDWGIHVNASPNHLLARNHWTSAAATAIEPLYDWQTLVATVAIETDQRLELSSVIKDARPSDGVMVIHDDSAELWYLAPNTAVMVAGNGNLLRSPGRQVVLRNDADRLALILAGAIARYGRPRARAEIVYRGLLPMGHLLGNILTVVEQPGSDALNIQAPITAVEWEMVGGRPTTTVRAGFAR